MKTLRWGIIGAGYIGGCFARGLMQTKSGEAVAIGDMVRANAEKLAGECNIKKVYGSADEVIADPDVDIVYIGMPHTQHAEWSIKAMDAGKHVLCEKPMAINHSDAMTVIEAARRNNVFFMEAFMFRCHPQTAKIVELVKSGVIGELRVIDASFSWTCGFNPEGRMFNAKLAGGGILDMGCYPVTMSRLIAGAGMGKTFADPSTVQAMGHIGETNVDEWAVASMKFDNDIFARIGTGIRRDDPNNVIVCGSKARLEIPNAWEANGEKAGELKIIITGLEREREEIIVKADKSIYAIEAETVAEAINADKKESAANSWADSLGNMATLDKWRAAIGLVYPCEKVEGYAMPVDKRPLSVRKGSKMTYGQVPNLDKKISRLIMGCDNQLTIAHATAMFDDFFARGGNCFDTANIYDDQGVFMEDLVGQWIKNRKIRNDIVLIGKGAHTPNCNPEGLRRELAQSLERLQVESVDLYFLHRDNAEIPVSEFVDALNELKKKGKMKAFGGSNWTMKRVMEANAYAAKKGLQGFSAISNNFSLARMVKPVWGGGVASSEPSFRKWHEETKTPLFAWSSQARGFFVPGRAHPDKKEDPELYESWYSDDNFKRQARCFELAKKKNVHPVTIALAYVLHQNFPVFALIGPRKIAETVGSMEGLSISLTPDEVKWLNLEA